MEADDVVLLIELRNIAGELMLFGIQATEDALEAQVKRHVTNLGAGFGKQLFRHAEWIAGVRNGQDHALVDGAEEIQ